MQLMLSLPNELIVDNFAGGGGASVGIEAAFGRPVDIAINHDAEAVAMHRANHPGTTHYCESVFKVNPVTITGNRPVGLAWFSPDCTHHSKARGGKPRSKKIRGLAWIVVRWARRVRPRVMMLENVEEFQDWGPLLADGTPCRMRKGMIFRRWVKEIERQGYRVESRELRGCDYGAPTIRKRLFVIARRDGLPIVWPAPTHGDPDSPAVKSGRLQPWPAAAQCIDWSLPAPSIFDRKRPLADNTLRRIARGVQRFVLEAADPFIVRLGHTGWNGDGMQYPATEPLTTVTSKAEHCLAVPHVSTYYGRDPLRGSAMDQPLRTQSTENRFALVSAFLAKHYGGNYQGPGVDLRDPTGTVTTQDHHALVAAHLLNQKGTDQRMRDLREPAPTVCAGGNHAGLVAALMAPYYGSGSGTTGRDLRDPAPTVTSKDRLQLVTVNIDGETFVLTDIGMRMLQPRELYRAQGFPDSYIIDPEVNGKRLNKGAQVRMCGNSVCPPLARALVAANFETEQQQIARSA